MHSLGKICPVHGFHPVNAGHAVAAGPGVLSCAGRAAAVPGREHTEPAVCRAHRPRPRGTGAFSKSGPERAPQT
jgi:hypothetical protein